MSDNKTRAFNLLAKLADARDFSAKDLEVRGNFSKPRDIIAGLRQGGQIERTFRLGREQFYRPVPGAPPPVDQRKQMTSAATEQSLRKRKRRSIIKRATAASLARRQAKKLARNGGA